MADPVRYDADLQIRVPASLPQAVKVAAAKRGHKPSEYVRQALVSALQADGVDPGKTSATDAGALYDLVDGRRRYAKVEAGMVTTMSYHDAKPDSGDWRQVVHEDSAAFDLATKWRLPPRVRVEPDRVTLTYPVIEKSGEWT